ncbi:MAG: acyl-CoA desaturase [Myxococcota bacterium]
MKTLTPTVPGNYRLLYVLPFMLVMSTLLIPIFTGFSWEMVALCVGSYYLRMFGITAGYHRYFAHRSYKTSRVFQFMLAFLAQTSGQKGTLWWAWHHRHHHKYSDTVYDTHSPVKHSFFWSHMGWIMSADFVEPELEKVKDLTRYPELVFLHKNDYLPPVAYALAITALWGWEGLLWGFFISTALLYHGTFTINSLAHVFGSKRYVTGDESRNNAFLALLTMGEGWHNNHHYYQASARQGFYWWEVDMSYMILKVLSWLGIVWDLKVPSQRVLEGGRSGHRLAEAEPEGESLLDPTLEPALSVSKAHS